MKKMTRSTTVQHTDTDHDSMISRLLFSFEILRDENSKAGQWLAQQAIAEVNKGSCHPEVLCLSCEKHTIPDYRGLNLIWINKAFGPRVLPSYI